MEGDLSMGQKGHQYAFVHRQFRVNAGYLKRPGDTEVASAIRRQGCNLFILEQDPPGGCPMVACDEIEIGRLPRPIWSNDGVNISFMDFEADIVDSPEFSKFLCYPLCLKKHIALRLDGMLEYWNNGVVFN